MLRLVSELLLAKAGDCEKGLDKCVDTGCDLEGRCCDC